MTTAAARDEGAIAQPYLLFLGDAPDQLAAKVARGIADWRPGACVGQLRMAGCRADLGLPDMAPDEAVAAGARTLVIGVANRGGVISPAWKEVLLAALEAGLDLAAGLHNRLSDEPELVAAAARLGRRLIDVRVPRRPYPIASGRPRAGHRLLTIGTDCSVGKMYASLAIEAEMRRRGMAADFRATGQTGILIAGDGVPLDAVVADFMAGAVEWLTPEAEPDHWDVIEGQGSLFHISYSGVTMALIHGGAPDALVLCHEPTRPHLRGLPDHPVPTLRELRDLALPIARIANPAVRVVGAAINTSALDEPAAAALLRETEAELGVPAVDPVRTGVGPIVDRIAAEFG